MKAIIYHTTADFRRFQSGHEKFPNDIYEKLMIGAKSNLEEHGIQLIHLTVKNYPGYGHENYYFDLDPEEVVYNREVALLEFIRVHSDDKEIYWLTEPDARIINPFPLLDNDVDLALLRRKDNAALTPAWRLFRPRALPIFERAFSFFDLKNKVWNGDTSAYVGLYEDMGPKPLVKNKQVHRFEYLGLTVELRDFIEYYSLRGRYVQQFKSKHKLYLVK